MPKIIFLIIEKSFLIRKGITSLIEEIENCDQPIEFTDIENINTIIKTYKPNIIFIGSELLKSVPLEIISRFKSEMNCRFISISHQVENFENELIDLQINLNEEKEELINKIIQITKSIKNKSSIKKNDHELSDRERDIVTLVAKGLTNKEIADSLFISVHTAMTHRKNIAKKLGIKTVSGITVYAILNKLIDMKDL